MRWEQNSIYRNVILLFYTVAWVFVVYGGSQALKSNKNDVMDWLPEHLEESQRLLEFAEAFGTDETLMVSWDGCNLEDPRRVQMEERLSQIDSAVGMPQSLFSSVISGRQALERLQAPPLALDRDAAISRLTGILLGKDGFSTCIVLTLADPEKIDRSRVLDFVYRCADSIDSLGRGQLHVAGTMVDGVAIDSISQEGLVSMTLISVAICFTLMWVGFRSLPLAVISILNAMFNQQMTLSLVYYTGSHMDSVLLMAPSLIFVTSVSTGVHLANYYRDQIVVSGLAGAARRAINSGRTPCWLSSVTTSLGLISLLASDMIPIRNFGIYAAVALILATVVIFIVLPCQLEMAFCRRWGERFAARHLANGSVSHRDLSEYSATWFETVARWVLKARWIIIPATCLLLAISFWGLTFTKASAKIHDMLQPTSKLLSDYSWLESRIGPLVPIEVVLKVPREKLAVEQYETPIVDQLQIVRGFSGVVQSVDGIETTLSAVTFSPDLPIGKPKGVRISERIRRTAMEKQLEANLNNYIEAGYLRQQDNFNWWRITGRVAASSRADYLPMLEDLNKKLTDAKIKADQLVPGIDLSVSGGVPMVQRAQDQLLKDLIASLVSAFGLIAVAIWFMLSGMGISEILRSASPNRLLTITTAVSAAVLATFLLMVPNILPCIGVFGAMGLLNVSVEVGTVMTATAAMGIAVDDTLHFVTWFRRGLLNGKSRYEATVQAFSHCAPAMLQTTLICGVGLLVFASSDFGPIRRFAWLMFSMLSSALIADLIVLPALLNSTWGRSLVVFRPQDTQASNAASK